jgi:DNA-binding NarL/FixJ family response regulator
MHMLAKKIRVLLVDDHAVVRTGVRLMLGAADDIEVAGESETAQDALRLCREQDFDVALVDVAMPGKNGLEFLKLLKSEKPNLAVLFLSMYSEDIYAVRALKLGAAGYLTKNSPTATIVAAVRKAAAGGKYISVEVVEQVAHQIGGGPMAFHEALSNRELEVLKLIVSGASLAKIAETLHLSPKTITTYRTRILEKTGLGSNVELARYALESGLLL